MRTMCSLLALPVLLMCAACGRVDPALTYLGLKNAQPPSPVTIDVLCDYGGAPCTAESLLVVAGSAVEQVALRPGSRVRVWWLGNSVGETGVIANVAIPPTQGESLRSREAHRTAVIAGGKATIDAAATPLFAGFTRRRSPILESLGKITMAADGQEREIWLVSDLLDEGLYRFECGSIPDEASFRQVLASILPPQSLRGARVVAVFAAPDVIAGERCAVSVDRFRRIVSLYETAVAQAGGDFLISPTNTPLVGGQP